MKKVSVLTILVCLLAIANFASADTFGTGSNAFNIDFVPISGSTNPTSGYGIVNNDYRMGTYEITNDQWDKFKAAYGTVTGYPSSAYNDNPEWIGTNVPVNRISWYEASQFVNYLNTSNGYQAAYKFTGAKGTSNYSFGMWQAGDAGYNASNPFRNSKAFYFLPTENEWVKAAYWNGTNLQGYATKAGESLYQGNGSNGGWNYDYYNTIGNQPWTVGSGSQELNGTYDMIGNVLEWMESPFYTGYLSDANRSLRGGSYGGGITGLGSVERSFSYDPSSEFYNLGFRVASVPEPCSLALLALGGLALRYRKS
jgi:formylglycine-generating enzyme required for sulfatase activity